MERFKTLCVCHQPGKKVIKNSSYEKMKFLTSEKELRGNTYKEPETWKITSGTVFFF